MGDIGGCGEGAGSMAGDAGSMRAVIGMVWTYSCCWSSAGGAMLGCMLM